MRTLDVELTVEDEMEGKDLVSSVFVTSLVVFFLDTTTLTFHLFFKMWASYIAILNSMMNGIQYGYDYLFSVPEGKPPITVK